MKTILLFLALVANAVVLDIITNDGNRSEGCAGLMAAGEELRFTHSADSTRLPVLKLPPDLQVRFFARRSSPQPRIACG